jgi:spore coat protein JB
MASNNTRDRCPEGMGSMPECAPLAVPYVPFQPTDPQRYSRMEALSQGTLFPGLNLPFHLMRDGKTVPRTPRTELQALCFLLQELGLYLDTHPEDQEAFGLFQRYAGLMEQAKQTYVERYGPLLRMDSAMDDHYTWAEGPWPWNAEGSGTGRGNQAPQSGQQGRRNNKGTGCAGEQEG